MVLNRSQATTDKQTKMQGKLYMLPVELGDAAHTRYLPSYNVEVMARLDAFVVKTRGRHVSTSGNFFRTKT